MISIKYGRLRSFLWNTNIYPTKSTHTHRRVDGNMEMHNIYKKLAYFCGFVLLFVWRTFLVPFVHAKMTLACECATTTVYGAMTMTMQTARKIAPK